MAHGVYIAYINNHAKAHMNKHIIRVERTDSHTYNRRKQKV